MSSTFINPSREDISATLLLSFAITSRFFSVNKEDSLTPFFLLMGFIAIILNFVYKILYLILRGIDYRKEFLPIASLSNAWRHNHFSIYKYRILTYWRYFFAGLVLLIFPSWGSEPFIFNWYSTTDLPIKISVCIFIIFSLVLAVNETRYFKTRLDIIRVTNAIEDLSNRFEKSFKQDDWETVLDGLRGMRKNILITISEQFSNIKNSYNNPMGSPNTNPIYANKSVARLPQVAKSPNYFPVFSPNLSFGAHHLANLKRISDDFNTKAQTSGDVVEMRVSMNEYHEELTQLEDWIKGLYNMSLE